MDALTLRVVARFIQRSEALFDAGIRRAVRILIEQGVETFESCEGGDGHGYPEPTIRFHGGQAEGFRAVGVALQNGLPVSSLRRYWQIEDGEPNGPHWEMTFERSPALREDPDENVSAVFRRPSGEVENNFSTSPQ